MALPSLAIIALGSNLGDSVGIIRAAIDRLQEYTSAPVLRSSLWRSSPVGCPPGSRDFMNAVVALVPRFGETPESLLVKMQALESAFGRQPRHGLNEPRVLDLDLIAFGSEIRQTERLTLPHPRAHLRRFVLAPLVEVAPDLILPGQQDTVTHLLAHLNTDEDLQRLA